MRSMNTAPSSAAIAPTDNSMPPVRMTNASPIAMMPNSPTWLAVFETLAARRKRGLMMATTVPTTRISTSSPTSFLKITSTSNSDVDAGLRSGCRSHRQPQDTLFTELRPIKKPADAAFVHHRDAVADADDLLH